MSVITAFVLLSFLRGTNFYSKKGKTHLRQTDKGRETHRQTENTDTARVTGFFSQPQHCGHLKEKVKKKYESHTFQMSPSTYATTQSNTVRPVKIRDAL